MHYNEVVEQIVEVVYDKGIIFSSIGELGKYFDLSTSRKEIQRYIEDFTEHCDEKDKIYMRGITSSIEGTFYLFFNAETLYLKYPEIDNLDEIIKIEAFKQLGINKKDIL